MSDDGGAAARVVQALADEGLLAPGTEDRSRAVVEHALTTEPSRPQAGGLPKLVEVVAYLGGALVIAAGFLFLLQSWDDLGDVGQVTFLAVVALVLGVAGAVTLGSGGQAATNDIRRRLSGTLLTGAALASGFAVGVAIEVSTDRNFNELYWPGLAGGLVVAVVSAVAYRFSSTAVGLVGMLGGALTAAINIVDAADGNESLWVGSAFFTVAVIWLVLTELGVFDQQTIARTLGAAVALFGAQVATFSGDQDWVGYLLTALVAAVGVWLYLVRLDWPYLAVAVIAVTLVVPEAVSDWTEGSLGVVGGVLVAGITLLAASFAGYRLRKEAND